MLDTQPRAPEFVQYATGTPVLNTTKRCQTLTVAGAATVYDQSVWSDDLTPEERLQAIGDWAESQMSAAEIDSAHAQTMAILAAAGVDPKKLR